MNRIWLQNFHWTGETDSWRAQTKPCAHQDLEKRSSVPTRDWAGLACACPGVSWGGMGQKWLATGSVALSTTVRALILLKEVTITTITPTIVWPQANHQGGNIAGPLTENWIKDLLSLALPIRTRPRLPHSQSLPSGSFHKPLVLIHQRKWDKNI